MIKSLPRQFEKVFFLITVIAVLASVFFSFDTQASYSMTELEATPLDVPNVVNAVVWDNSDTSYPEDDDKQTVAIGFPFQFDTTLYNDVTILTNGILKFGDVERMHRDYINESLPTDEGDRFIAVYWDDLVDDAASSVTYGNLGVAPNRSFVVNWTNVKAYANNLRYDFQVVLYENGDIRYRYNNNTSNGQSATIGLEIDDSDFIQYSHNQVSIEVSFDLLFRNSLLALPMPIAQYRLDEESWNSTLNEVLDSSGNSLNGTAINGANSSDAMPALGTTIGTCRYGEFDGVNDAINIPDTALLDLNNNFSVGVWVNINSLPTSGLKTIVSKDENYEFHVNSSGQINWWWQISGGGTQQFNSTRTISAGSWHHIVISYANGNQTIFINGLEAGSATFSGSVLNNSDSLQIASDQGFVGRQFNGRIDEVNIFDQTLLQTQAMELMNTTRPCASFNLCVSSFPDGLNSHTAGDLDFGRDVQLFFSPDDTLNAGSISLNGSSTQRSCVSVECSVNNLAVEPTMAQSFPNTAPHTTNENIANGATGSIGNGENKYNDVILGNSSTLNVLGGYTNYYIDNLSAGNNATLNLVAGTYWINAMSVGTGLNIAITGNGTARVYINNSVSLSANSIINSPSSGNQGDASQFFLYSYSNINMADDTTFSGVMYAVSDISIGRDSSYYGAITGADISIDRDTNIFFNPAAAADLNYGDLCEGASCTLGSFAINQPAYALACPGTRSEVSLQAMCDDGTTIKDDYIGIVDLSTTENNMSEFYASANAGALISATIFDGSELGIKNVYLFHQNENPSLQVIANDSAAAVTTTSANATDFRTFGFSVTTPSSFTCGDSQSITLTAVGEDASGASCQVLTGFTGTKNIKSWYSANINADVATEFVNANLVIEGQSINDQVEPASNNISLTFNSGIANASLAYENSAQILGVNFKHDDAPYDSSIPNISALTASTAAFVVRPEKIAISISDVNAQCAAQDASCSKFVAAGSPFSMTLEAQCIGASIATDYQGSINLTHSVLAPSPGVNGLLAVSNAGFTDSDGGSVSINNQVISEVGVFDLTTVSSSYFGETIPAFTLDSVGRFYPYQFAMLSQNTSNSCGTFSYMNQSGIVINYSLQAQNFNGDLTSNYDGAFALASTGFVVENNNDGGSYQDRLNGFGNGSWTNGVYSHIDSGRFSRANLGLVDGPYQDLQVAVQLSDGDNDESELIGLDLRADSSDDCGSAGNCNAKLIGRLDLRFGQLKLSNVFGPEEFDLEMNVQTEYFDGTRFIVNSDDSCTSLQVTSPIFTATQWDGNLTLGETAPNFTGNIVDGVSMIRFDAAGIGNDGSITYEYDAPSWLRTENTGNGDYTDKPLGTVTFGQFRGNDRMIYWRELVR